MEKGDCPYITKAHHARRAGARLAIVFLDDDSNPLAYIPTSAMDRKMKAKSVSALILISKSDGLKILEAIDEGKTVKLFVDFEIPKGNPPANVKFWFSPVNKEAY